MVTGSRVERKKYNKNNKQRNQKPSNYKSILKKLFIFLISLFFLMVIAGAGIFGYYAMKAPNIAQNDLESQVASKIYDKNGNLIKELGSQKRDLLTKDEIPQVLKDAVLAIEDARFYNHKGVDPIRIIGALLSNLKSGDIVQGGSTITQQLIKLSVFSTDFKDQTLERKAQEAWLSLQIEQEYTKDEILTFYLNKLFYSNNIYGAKTAAKTFFNKELKDLSISEAALLAGIPQAPSKFDPYTNPSAAQKRRDVVLNVMLDRKLITNDQFQEAINIFVQDLLVPLDSGNLKKQDLVIDAYLDVVAKELQDNMGINIYTDGVEVYTNLDYQAQEHLYDLVNSDNGLFPNDKLQTAVSIVDSQTGQLVAVLGGRKQEVTMGLNRANVLKRSVASTIKPLVDYGPAFEYLDYSTGTLVVDEEYKYSNGDKIYNYDQEYKGNMTLREALVGSRNIPALKVLQNVGLDNAYAFLQKMDINILNNNSKELVESNAIGGEITPIQLSAAYATIANHGVYIKPYTVSSVKTSNGTEEVFKPESRQAMKDSTAYMLIDILKGVPKSFAKDANIDNFNHAGKTGSTNYTDEQMTKLGLTSNTYAVPDAWYAGISPEYSISTWVGYDSPLEKGNYLTYDDYVIPQKIYKDMMTYLSNNSGNSDWAMPNNLVRVEIEKYTDPIMLPGPYTPAEAKSSELFIKGTEPTEQSLAYGKYIEAPTGLDATFDEETKEIKIKWDPIEGNGQFQLTINDTVVYTGTDTSFTFPVTELGEYTIRLKIIEGNNSSDTVFVTIKLKDPNEETTNETTDMYETTIYDPMIEETFDPYSY